MDTISGKTATVPRLVSEPLFQNENKCQIMNVQTKWNCLIPILSTLVNCFRSENVKLQVMGTVRGKIATVPRLVSEHSYQNENKHQIMNVHTKWNCLIPILSPLVKYYLFQA